MKVKWKISIDDGYCEYRYRIRISENESISSVYEKIRKLFKARKCKAIARNLPELKEGRDGCDDK